MSQPTRSLLRPFADRSQPTELGLGLAALGRPDYINLGHGQDTGTGRSIEAMRARAFSVLDDPAVHAELAHPKTAGTRIGLTRSGARQADTLDKAPALRVDGERLFDADARSGPWISVVPVGRPSRPGPHAPRQTTQWGARAGCVGDDPQP